MNIKINMKNHILNCFKATTERKMTSTTMPVLLDQVNSLGRSSLLETSNVSKCIQMINWDPREEWHLLFLRTFTPFHHEILTLFFFFMSSKAFCNLTFMSSSQFSHMSGYQIALFTKHSQKIEATQVSIGGWMDKIWYVLPMEYQPVFEGIALQASDTTQMDLRDHFWTTTVRFSKVT